MSYSLTADGGPEDLPRTLRREKEAREREAREREAAERAAAQREALPMGGPPEAASMMMGPADRAGPVYALPDAAYAPMDETAMPALVTRIDVPFFHLVAFFLKAVIAAIPALVLLAVLMWGLGQLLQAYFPWLVKAQILIHFPNG